MIEEKKTEEKKIRSDKAKNTAKVLKEVINNPLSTVREIEENTWVSKSTASRIINEDLGQIRTSEKIVDLVALDIEMQELATAEMIRRLKHETEKVNNTDIVRFNETSLKRSQLLWLKDNWNKEIVVKFEI